MRRGTIYRRVNDAALPGSYQSRATRVVPQPRSGEERSRKQRGTHRQEHAGHSNPATARIGSEVLRVVWTYPFPKKDGIVCEMADQYSLRVHIEEVENGQFLATSDDMPGLVAQGRTIEEAIEIAGDVVRRLIESYQEHGDPIPEGLPEGTVRAILKQANVSTDVFLNA